jgi:hypothetical protein
MHESPVTDYSKLLSPWRIYRLGLDDKWHLVNKYRTRGNAEEYAAIIRRTSIQPIKVVFGELA